MPGAAILRGRPDMVAETDMAARKASGTAMAMIRRTDRPSDEIMEGAVSPASGPEFSEHDREFLREREGVIRAGLRNFLDVGRALRDIRDHRSGELWKAKYGTFDNYCKARWDIQRQHAHRLVDAAEVVGQMAPVGGNTPTHERQVRPLCQLAKAEDRAKAWAEAVENHGPSPRGRDVHAVVHRMLDDGAEPRSDRPQKAREARGERRESLRLDHSELTEIHEYLEIIDGAIPEEEVKAREALDGLREIFNQ